MSDNEAMHLSEPSRRAHETGTDFGVLTALAVSIATQAAELVAELAGSKRELVETKSSPTDVVTEVDRASERLLVSRLRQARPHDGIIGEEGAFEEGTSGVRWVLDPLDGTTNYLYGLPPYAVSVAAEMLGQAVAAAVTDAASMDTYSAAAGAGAWLNGNSIAVRRAPALATALVGTGFAYDPAKRRRQADVLRRILPAARDIRSSGVASLDLCYVAVGRIDAFYEVGLKRWDWAAGALVATEAGAWVGSSSGDRPGDSIIAAPEPLASELRALVLDAGS
ncbi:MAG: inositol monophosphatase family protein [Acidimicrobiales bacterium]